MAVLRRSLVSFAEFLDPIFADLTAAGLGSREIVQLCCW